MDSSSFETPLTPAEPETLVPAMAMATAKKIEYSPTAERELKLEAEQFVANNTMLFNAIAEDSSLQYAVGNGFSIDLKAGKINLDVADWKWKRKHNLDNTSMVWSTCHEIAHFYDLKEDPEGMWAGFKRLQERSRELSQKIRPILERRFGKAVPAWLDKAKPIMKGSSETMTGLQRKIYQQLHGFYNALDDIYVNRRVGRKIPDFLIEGGRRSQKVEQLYQNFLFPTGKQGQPPLPEQPYDQTSQAKSSQFGNYFLRQTMVPDQPVICSPDVEQLLKAPQIGGKTTAELVDLICTPSLPGQKPAHNATWRYRQIASYVEPLFEQLLLQDYETLPLPPKPEKQKGEGSGEGDGEAEESDEEGESEEGEGEDGKPSNKKSPWGKPGQNKDNINDQTVADYLKQKKQKEQQDKREEKKIERGHRLTPQQTARAAQRKSDAEFAQQNGIPVESMREYRQLQAEVAPYSEALAQVFEKICQQLSRQISVAWDKYFRSGKFDMQRFIRKYGQYFQDGAIGYLPFEQLDAYEQKEFIETLKLKPEEFRLRLVVDISGSMAGEKINAAKETMVLLLDGLALFEDKIERMFRQMSIVQPPLRVDTQVVVFGATEETQEVKGLRGNKARDPQQERTDRLRAFSRVQPTGTSTENSAAWEKVAQTVSPQDKERMRNGMLRDIAIEITDGGTQTPQAARDILAMLETTGMVTRGLQVGEVAPEEKAIFDSVWGQDGEHLGEVSQLPKIMSKLLEKLLQNLDLGFEFTED